MTDLYNINFKCIAQKFNLHLYVCVYIYSISDFLSTIDYYIILVLHNISIVPCTIH